MRQLQTGQLGTSAKKGGKLEYFIKNYDFYLLLVPAIAFYFIFKYLPMYGILMAFKDYNFMIGVFGSPWVGLDVFREVFKESSFWEALRNTIRLNFLSLLVAFPLPIVFALFLNEIKNN